MSRKAKERVVTATAMHATVVIEQEVVKEKSPQAFESSSFNAISLQRPTYALGLQPTANQTRRLLYH